MCGSFTNNYAAWCHFQSTELPNVSQGKMETRSRCGGIFAASQGKVATQSRCGGISDDVHTCDYLESMTEDAQ